MLRKPLARKDAPSRASLRTMQAEKETGSGSVPLVAPPQVLREYAFLGDGHRGALIGPEGDCVWLCFPGWSDPAVFASLIGSGGQYLVQPSGRWVWGGYYEDGSLIWTSRWVSEHGIFQSREALAYPGQPDRMLLLRRVRALDVAGRFNVVLDPRADYGRRAVGTWRRKGPCWEARGEGMAARWWGADEAASRRAGRHHRLELEFILEPQEERDLVLELVSLDPGARDPAPERPDPDQLWRRTEEAWASAVPECEGMVAGRDVRRSYAVLRGMTGPEGGTIAAATTSLPERAESNRNYDYRYVWIRDTCYIGRAGAAVRGGEPMLDDAVRWVADRLLAEGDNLAPAYCPDGGVVPSVSNLDLPGYPGGTDVIGNRIGDQFQLDAFGEALLLLATAASRHRLGPDGWRAAQIAAGAIERRWSEPDSGIWELTPPEEWTSSRLICVAGLRALCESGAPPEWTTNYMALADTILADTSRRSMHPTGRWQRTPDDERVDAALLLGQIRGAVAPDDPRSAATRRAVAEELADDGYVYRYAAGDEPLGEAEGAFLICNFWMSAASWDAGDGVDAVRWFERARTAAGPPGLLTEELDVLQHQLRGNFPQAFVHAALIEAAAGQDRR
jgi:alpha,alpha-trehalase